MAGKGIAGVAAGASGYGIIPSVLVTYFTKTPAAVAIEVERAVKSVLEYAGVPEEIPLVTDVFSVTFWVSITSLTKYVARNLQELSRGIASYFRVNNRKRLKGEEMMLNPKVFRERIQEEIANGPGPAVPPPEVKQLTPEEVKAQEEAQLKEQEDLQRLLDETPFVGRKM